MNVQFNPITYDRVERRPVLLFDWGDTLMHDDSTQTGKMCDWPQVNAINHAVSTLALLANHYFIGIATGAADSTEHDIYRALRRVELDAYISTIFCQNNLKVGKDSNQFFVRILDQLGCQPSHVTMVGDCLARDVLSAQAAGLNAIWFRNKRSLACSCEEMPERNLNIATIDCLSELPSRLGF
ncbi:HAD hydrolase-like protein [Vibrio sp. SM6]|uniref:HAD hydrolase-like protein n=1 Tax=Vibrio agarilyticus TaxID=2726741 RepID=A0A7X8YGY9_9VIBR|nr:HAD hydrolase-like protein [Vibrio agarilyticus]NLS13030.1 HAD hydrolase-like protein [Vibrio agarilyticus]